MLNVLGKTLLALIAATLVANPVMACCFQASSGPEQGAVQNEEPPCHGAQNSPSTSSASVAQPADLSCSGCGDCTSAMMAADFADEMTVGVTFENEHDLSVTFDSSLGFDNATVPVTNNIPSGLPPRSIASPVSLKQKLLI